jgi:hypothetical protein
VIPLAIAAITIVATFGVWALVSTRQAGNQKARADVFAEKNRELTDKLAERGAVLIEAKETIRALNIAIAEAAADVAPVDGSMQRLLQAVAKIHAANGSPSVVPDAGSPSAAPEPVDRAGDSELLKPGE